MAKPTITPSQLLSRCSLCKTGQLATVKPGVKKCRQCGATSTRSK